MLPIRHLWYFPNSCLWLLAAGAATGLTWDSISCLRRCSQGQAARTGYRCRDAHTHTSQVKTKAKWCSTGGGGDGLQWLSGASCLFFFPVPGGHRFFPWLVTLIQAASHKIQTLFDVKHNPQTYQTSASTISLINKASAILQKPVFVVQLRAQLFIRLRRCTRLRWLLCHRCN